MLLDRKKINRYAKVMAVVLVVVFGLSFVALGVGSGVNLNWSDLWNSIGSKSQSGPNTPEQNIKVYTATLKTDPKNETALLGIAAAYRQLQLPAKQAEYLEKLAALKPTDVSIQLQLASIYMSAEARDYQAAVRVLNKATTLDPANAEAFLQLGSALRGTGDTNAALLAWNRYLELAPNGNMAQTVKEQIALLTAPATTVTTGSSTGTTSGGTPTTAPVSSATTSK